MGSVDKVLRVFRCGNVYQRSFEVEKDIADEARKNLHDALVNAYAKGLDVLAETHSSLTKGVASQVLQQLIYPGQTKGRLSDLTTSERTLRDCGSQCAESLGIKLNEDIRHAIASLDRPLDRIDDMVKAIMANISDKERLDWLKWISDIRYMQDHDEVKERRTEGTSGTGKTLLASNVIDYMRGSAKGSDEGFAFFYCSRLKEDNRRQPLSVFQSFVRQLSTSHRQEQLMRQDLLDLCKEKEAQGTVLRIPTCKEQIQTAANLYPRTTLIIDAFDECDGDDDGRFELARSLAELVRKSKHVVRVFITSRYDQDLASAFTDNPAALVEVTARQNSEDIKTFVRKELEKLKTRGNRAAIVKREEAILQRLDGQSNGMFQWAKLMVDQLASSKSQEGLDEMINDTSLLPNTLKGVYNSIYSSISTRADKEIVRRAMMWATASYELELDIPALLDAVQLSGEDDQDVPTQGKVTLDQLMSLCSGFLNVVKSWRIPDAMPPDFREEWTVIRRPELQYLATAGFE
ncbi:hypothetical protein K4K61_002938 [Colletotrichum sp. SAR11_59]|nr:hypothetical protein K4K61_002938 [Colletotrichum sp. SAR11_59]